MNLYQTLGLVGTATEDDIRMAYRRLAMKWHPDRHQSESDKTTAEEQFKAIQEAYRTLSDPQSRHRYDLQSATAGDPYGFGAGMADGFDDFMRDHMHRASSYRGYEYPPGADVKWKAVISLRTALEGGEVIYSRKVNITCPACIGHGWFEVGCDGCAGRGTIGSRSNKRYCPKCLGQGRVEVICETCDGKRKVSESVSTRIRIPAGVVDGSEIEAKNLGKPSKYFGGPAGNLNIIVQIKPEGGFKFAGLDIVGILKIPFSIALLGGKAEVQLPTGRQLLIDIPARSNTGKKIRLSGCGLRNREGREGDAILSVTISLPKSRRKLTEQEEAIIRKIDF